MIGERPTSNVRGAWGGSGQLPLLPVSALLEATPLAVAILTEEGKVLYLNERFAELYGLGKGELEGSCLATIHPDLTPMRCEDFLTSPKTFVKNHEAVEQISVIFRPDGTETYVETRRTAFHGFGHKDYILLFLTPLQAPAETSQKNTSGEPSQLPKQVLTVCAWTGKVLHRGSWLKVDEFLREELNMRVSHGMCPDVAKHWNFMHGSSNEGLDPDDFDYNRDL